MKNYKVHFIQEGETLQRIAIYYGLDNWKLLVDVNSLNYPFIAAIGEDVGSGVTVKRPGDMIYIPLDGTDRPLTPTVESDYNLEYKVFGSDCSLNHDFDQVPMDIRSWDKAGEFESFNGDLKVYSGLDNLVQALEHRLATDKGELPLHPDYGCGLRKLIGKRGSHQIMTKAKLEILRSLKQDPRVKDVNNVTIRFGNRTASIECGIVTINPYDSEIAFSTTITN